jgi:hypothetical protein
MQADIAFKDELEVFRKEEEVAQQYFFAWLQVRAELAANEKLLDRINDTPLFWITTHHALILAAFVALGRILTRPPTEAAYRCGIPISSPTLAANDC